MKRWFSHCVITLYLGCVLFGVAVHAVEYREHDHPAMYFIVWDMFCGWTAWEQRLHIIGEGESGEYYELAPGPWGDYEPFGNLDRHHYDPFVNHAARMAVNTLHQTQHEPIHRVFVIEEVWAKKYNLPVGLQQELTPVPGEKRTYCYVRDVYTADGTVIRRGLSWFSDQAKQSLWNNPRLARQTQFGRPQYVVSRPENVRAGEVYRSGYAAW